jgi:flagellar motor switch/type III secretory pathway protein FliN
MSQSAIPWLPESALTDARTCEPAARCLRNWSEDWLQKPGLCVPPRWEKAEKGVGGTGYEAIGDGSGYILSIRIDGELELASALLGKDIDDRNLRTSADRLLIRKLTDAAIDDLARRVSQVLGSRDSQGPLGECSFALPVSCIEPAPLFRLEASQGLLAGIARHWAGSARPAAAPQEWRASLDGQPVRLSALAGRTRLLLAEVEHLGIGDVLTLDTPVDGLLDACIEHRISAAGALSLIPGEDGFMLQIERPPIQW